MRDNIGNRMKENYENPAKTRLMKRVPVIVRLDMRAGHTFTKGFDKPFDEVFMYSMIDTTNYLVNSTQGCTLGYVQSDEISLLLTDYATFTSEPYFDYEVEKICSTLASTATLRFNRAFSYHYASYRETTVNPLTELLQAYNTAEDRGATFDCRCFNIPKEEVTNYFLWRQLDAIRNSIQSLGRKYFSSKALYGLNCNEIKALLKECFQVDWDDLYVTEKRGTFITRGGSDLEYMSTFYPDLRVAAGRELLKKYIYIEQE